jgi:hypothetical protein
VHTHIGKLIIAVLNRGGCSRRPRGVREMQTGKEGRNCRTRAVARGTPVWEGDRGRRVSLTVHGNSKDRSTRGGSVMVQEGREQDTMWEIPPGRKHAVQRRVLAAGGAPPEGRSPKPRASASCQQRVSRYMGEEVMQVRRLNRGAQQGRQTHMLSTLAEPCSLIQSLYSSERKLASKACSGTGTARCRS